MKIKNVGDHWTVSTISVMSSKIGRKPEIVKISECLKEKVLIDTIKHLEFELKDVGKMYDKAYGQLKKISNISVNY